MNDSTLWMAVGSVMALICGVLGRFVATQKGRPSTEGFMLGLLFGPFGVLIEGLLPTLVRETTKPEGPVRSAAPGLIRPRRSIRDEDTPIPQAGDPVGWLRYRRPSTGEVFWTPAPKPPETAKIIRSKRGH